MSVELHTEHQGMVVAKRPWGLDVLLSSGVLVTVDTVKAIGTEVVGDVVSVVILDDERTPPRASLLDVDRAIAAEIRQRAGDDSP